MVPQHGTIQLFPDADNHQQQWILMKVEPADKYTCVLARLSDLSFYYLTYWPLGDVAVVLNEKI